MLRLNELSPRNAQDKLPNNPPGGSPLPAQTNEMGPERQPFVGQQPQYVYLANQVLKEKNKTKIEKNNSCVII